RGALHVDVEATRRLIAGGVRCRTGGRRVADRERAYRRGDTGSARHGAVVGHGRRIRDDRSGGTCRVDHDRGRTGGDRRFGGGDRRFGVVHRHREGAGIGGVLRI